eukprot:6188331-Ditylum_brightwellii.AAC.1
MITLQWTASTDNVEVTGYGIYRDGDKIAEIAPGTSYTDEEVAPSKKYAYSVKAFDAAGNLSEKSNTIEVRTADDKESPSRPASLKALSVSDTQVTIEWFASSDNVEVTGYHIYRGNKKIATDITGTSYTDTGVDVLKTYTYYVVAVDAAGNVSENSDSIEVTTDDVTPPDTPGNLLLSSVSEDKAIITWAPSSDNVAVKGYNIYRDGNKIAEIPPGISYADEEVVPSYTYTYSVEAFDAAGNGSENSDSVQVTIPDETSPSQPTKLELISVFEDKASITWAPSSDNVGVTGYRIYRDNTMINTVTGTSYMDTGLDILETYTYYVVAVDAAGNESEVSDNIEVTTVDLTPPSKPSNLLMDDVTEAMVTLQWTASTDNVEVTGYRIYRDGGWI